MSELNNDSSVFEREEIDSFSVDYTHEELDSAKEQKDEQHAKRTMIQENKGTTYAEENSEEVGTITPVKPVREDVGYFVNEYENWEGRIVDVEDSFVRARVINTQHYFAPRIMQISKSVFVANGIVQTLNIGDMFELTYKTVQSSILTKQHRISQLVRNVKDMRMIEPVRLTRCEIDSLAANELEALSYLFE